MSHFQFCRSERGYNEKPSQSKFVQLSLLQTDLAYDLSKNFDADSLNSDLLIQFDQIQLKIKQQQQMMIKQLIQNNIYTYVYYEDKYPMPELQTLILTDWCQELLIFGYIRNIPHDKYGILSKIPREIKHAILCTYQNFENQYTMKNLKGILNKITPENSTKMTKVYMEIVNNIADTKHQMRAIIKTTLQSGSKTSLFAVEFVKLISNLQQNVSTISFEWITNTENDILGIFSWMVIEELNDLFNKYEAHVVSKNDERISKHKNKFFSTLILVAELYNVGMIKTVLVCRGVVQRLFDNMCCVQAEGLCILLKQCAQKLNEEAPKYVELYLQKLRLRAKKLDVRTKVIVEQTIVLFGNTLDGFRKDKNDVS
eukprot:416071_1